MDFLEMDCEDAGWVYLIQDKRHILRGNGKP